MFGFDNAWFDIYYQISKDSQSTTELNVWSD